MSSLENRTKHPLIAFPEFRKLFLGDVLVAIAERFFAITAAWWLISKIGEHGKQLGVMMALQAIPVFLLGMVVGPWIDRYDKKKCMVMGVLGQAACTLTIVLLLTFGKLTFPLLAALGFVMGCFVPQFEAAVNASTDKLVDEERLASATAIQSSKLEFSNIIAATASTSIIALGGIQLAYWVDLALYLIGALFLILVQTELRSATPVEGSSLSYFEDIKQGISYIWNTVEMRWFVIVFALESFFVVPIFILIPMLVKTNLNSQIAWVAVFETVLSIGAVIISVLMSFQSRYRHFYPTFATSLIALGLLLCLLGRVSHPYAMAAVIFGLGSLFAAMMSLSYMMFQHVVPGELKGRFFGVVGTVGAGMAPLSFMLVGILSEVISLRTVLLINGLGAVSVAFVVLWIPRLRSHLGPDEDGSLGSVEEGVPQ